MKSNKEQAVTLLHTAIGLLDMIPNNSSHVGKSFTEYPSEYIPISLEKQLETQKSYNLNQYNIIKDLQNDVKKLRLKNRKLQETNEMLSTEVVELDIKIAENNIRITNQRKTIIEYHEMRDQFLALMFIVEKLRG